MLRAGPTLLLLGAAACAETSSARSTAATVEVEPPAAPSTSGSAPAAALTRARPTAWSGAYFSVTIGDLHLQEERGTVTGKWMRPVKDR